MSLKNPLTPSGIEPATFRFVVQHLNHCATAAVAIRISDLLLSFIRSIAFRACPSGKSSTVMKIIME